VTEGGGVNSGSGTNWFYSFDLGYAHFVGFSSEVYFNSYLSGIMATQYEWLQSDLAKAVNNRANVPWIIAFAHRPQYCSNVDDMPDCSTDAETLRTGINGQFGIEALLLEYNVDIFFCGHEHSYERSFPVSRGHINQQQNQTYLNPIFPIHILCGSAGCPEDLDYYDEVFYGPWSVVRSSSYGYGHLSVMNATHLHWRQLYKTANGAQQLLDEVWIIQENRTSLEEAKSKHTALHEEDQCNHYCHVVCESNRKKNNLLEKDCAKLCGGNACVGASTHPADHSIDIRTSKVLIHRRH